MKKLLLIVFLIVTLVSTLACLDVLYAQGTSYTFVDGGVIDSDTTWTLANTPYFVKAPVLVNTGVTLTIEPGVTVYLNKSYIRVDGVLRARGTGTNKISIICNGTWGDPSANPAIEFTEKSTSWNELTTSGSILENALISSTQDGHTVSMISTSPKINNCTVTSSTVTSANSGRSAIWIGSGASIISNNSITSNNLGIRCGGNTYTIISDNIISNCRIGIRIDGGYGGAPLIEHNLIINNTGNKLNGGGGIQLYYSNINPLIRNNTIVKNSVGFNAILSPTPNITSNNIYDNNEYSIYLNTFLGAGSKSNINATYNWWGTTDTQVINQTIYDFKNDFNLGNVTFVPFLTMPNPAAPTIPTYTIAASAGAGGSISPSGNVTVGYGSSQTFTVTPNTGYQIVSVLIDGKPATAPYTFTSVADGHTISATFEPTPVVPEFPSTIILALLVTATLAIAVAFRRKLQTKPLT